MVFVAFQGQHWYTLKINCKNKGNSKLVLRTVIETYYSKMKEIKCIITEFLFIFYTMIIIYTEVSLRAFVNND